MLGEMSRRAEFGKQVKRDADERSNGHCEGTGAMYGLASGKRCNAILHGKRKEYDHILACSNGGDNSLNNCAVICGTCHDFKSHRIDTPRAAKIVRQRDKNNGVRSSRSFPRAPAGYNHWTRRIEQ